MAVLLLDEFGAALSPSGQRGLSLSPWTTGPGGSTSASIAAFDLGTFELLQHSRELAGDLEILAGRNHDHLRLPSRGREKHDPRALRQHRSRARCRAPGTRGAHGSGAHSGRVLADTSGEHDCVEPCIEAQAAAAARQ
jgi:hypothetical protein